MELSLAILSRSARAIAMAKSIAAMPALVFTNPPMFIPLELETYSKDGAAEVASNPVIVTGKTGDVKKEITDNVAPKPWSWTLSGYIPGITALEQTNLFTPFVRFNTDMISFAFEEGMRLTYKDKDCKFYKNQVIIENLSIGMQADCANKTPFTMTLRQIVTIDMSETVLDKIQQMAQPSDGSITGAEVSKGSTNTTENDFNLRSTLKQIFLSLRKK